MLAKESGTQLSKTGVSQGERCQWLGCRQKAIATAGGQSQLRLGQEEQ
jgi:hypothetical protein